MHPGIPELGAYGSDSRVFRPREVITPGSHLTWAINSGWPLQQRVSNPNLNIPRGGGGQGRSNKQLRGSHSDSLLLNVKNLEDDTLVDIVCKTAKKVMLEASARKNRANSKVAGLRDRDSLELMGENNHPLDPYAEPPSLKAVELANALRSKLGVYILGHVRDVFGGLLNLLEKQPHVFRVVRIPKNDHVILLEGPTPSTSHGVLPTPRDNPSPAITLEQEFSPHGSNESGGSAVYGSMAYQGVQQQQQPVSQQAQYPYAYDNAPSVPRSSPFSNAPSPRVSPGTRRWRWRPSRQCPSVPDPSPFSVGVRKLGHSRQFRSVQRKAPDSVFVGHGLDGVLDGLDPGTWMVSEPAADRRSTAEVSSAFFPGLLSGPMVQGTPPLPLQTAPRWLQAALVRASHPVDSTDTTQYALYIYIHMQHAHARSEPSTHARQNKVDKPPLFCPPTGSACFNLKASYASTSSTMPLIVMVEDA